MFCLPPVLVDIVMDYAAQMEHSEKLTTVLSDIRTIEYEITPVGSVRKFGDEIRAEYFGGWVNGTYELWIETFFCLSDEMSVQLISEKYNHVTITDEG